MIINDFIDKLLKPHLIIFIGMNAPGVVSKIFWPAHTCSTRTRSGFLVGWNVRRFTACVAAVISNVKVSFDDTILS